MLPKWPWSSYKLQANTITLTSDYGDCTGKAALSFSLTRTSWEIADNHLLPHALGTTLTVFGTYNLDVKGGNSLPGRIKGKIVFVKDARENNTSMMLLDAGDHGLLHLTTPKLSMLPPRVQSALMLAEKCLM